MKFKELFDENANPLWDKIATIPEFAALKDTPQNKQWHQEGNAWEHTIRVTECMKKKREEHPESQHLFLMASALCHDLGKPTTTYYDEDDEDYHCKNHGAVGERIARNLFADEETCLRERVCAMVRNHMAMHQIVQQKTDFTRLMKLSYCGVTVNDLITLYVCDSNGSKNSEDEEFIKTREEKLRVKAKELGCLDIPFQFATWEGKYDFLNGWSTPIIKPTMFVTIGLPGAGKDYWVEHHLPSDVVVISRDKIRSSMGIQGEKPQGTKKEEKDVTKIQHSQILDCLKNQKSFVIADTNIHQFFRKELLKLVMPYTPHIVFVYVDTPIEICKERRKGQMPLGVIDRMWEELDFPTLKECDDLILVNGYEDNESN